MNRCGELLRKVKVDYGLYTLYGIRGLNVVVLHVRPSDTIQNNVKFLRFLAYVRIMEQVDQFYNMPETTKGKKECKLMMVFFFRQSPKNMCDGGLYINHSLRFVKGNGNKGIRKIFI
jgi:hypothetical protein